MSQTSAPPAISVIDDQSFEQLFKSHFRELHAYAAVMLRNEDMAEEIVQSMFLRFWEKRELLNIQSSVRAFLYKCVYNDCLNYLKHQKIKTRYQDFAAHTMNNHHEAASAKTELNELQINLQKALNELPEQCRTIFQMSRFEELKYREIAERLQISIKTVENQMGKALRILRVKLSDFVTLILPGIILYYRDFFN